MSQKPTDKQLKRRLKQFDHKDFERMETILAALKTGLALINRDMTIEWVNAETLKILPWDELVGKICYEAAAKRDEP